MVYKGILSSGEVGNMGIKQLREQRELVMNKWEGLGLLEGLNGYSKETIAQLFENQASYMINESTTSDSSGAFETVAFPVIRRVFSKLLANEIVSVQALNMPIGRVYFYNPKVSKRKSDESHYVMDGAYSNAAGNYSLNTDGRRVSKTAGTQFESYSLYDGFYAQEATEYGDVLYDRSAGRIFVKAPVLSGGTFTNGTTIKYTTFVTGFTTTNAGKLVGPVGIPMDTEEFFSSLKIVSNVAFTAVGDTSGLYSIPAGKEIPYRVPAQAYAQQLVDASGKIKVELDLSWPGAADGTYIALSGASAPTFSATYRVYSDLEEDAEMSEVSFDLDYVTVDVGQPRKMRATFTPEVAQDAAAFQSINVEAELTALLSETVGAEIDRTILRELRAGAAWFERWDYRGFTKRTGITRADYNQELVIKINEVSAAIQKSTLRGGATWLVVSPEVSAIFNSLEYFHVSDASPEETKYSMGIEKVGSLQGRYNVFVDSNAPANTILLGHKGDSIFHAGFLYCPYVPLMLMPKMMNYTNGSSVFMVMSRFATKFVNNRFFGKIYVDGINSIATGAELRG